jgi:uncharacterized protein YhbP (UPF0306 family)
MKPEKRITDFLKRHHVLTLATSASNQPWCANCFYVYLEEENILAFTSDKKTRHIRESSNQSQVAGSIVLETRMIGKIQGIQFLGNIEEPTETLLETVRNAYIRRFPIAMLMDTTMWIVRLTYIKMTDNRLGFGKKLIWEPDTSVS